MKKLQEILENGFEEDDFLEGVFLIGAKSKNTFFNRKRKLEILSGFSDGGSDNYEEDEEGDVWQVITTAWFDDIAEAKRAIEQVEKYTWLYLYDSYILLEGEYLFANGS